MASAQSATSQLVVEFKRLPLLARSSALSSLALSLAVQLRWIRADSLPLDWVRTLHKLELWRPLTSLFFLGKPSGGAALSALLLYNSLALLEREKVGCELVARRRRTYKVLCVGIAVMLSGSLLASRKIRLPLLSGALTTLSTTLWALECPEDTVSSNVTIWVFFGFHSSHSTHFSHSTFSELYSSGLAWLSFLPSCVICVL